MVGSRDSITKTIHSPFGACAFLVVGLLLATVWRVLTNPVTVATAAPDGEIAPIRLDPADVLSARF